MSLKAELETWASALKAYDEEDFEKSLELFSAIGDSSKILTNMGLIYAALGEHEAAVEQFQAATQLDQYLAVAYFQCGVSNFLLTRYDLAYRNFEEALLFLRGNQSINYEQLGLKFKLYSAEVLFNKGLSLLYSGRGNEGMQDLNAALLEKVTEEHNVIDDAIADRGEGYTVFSIPVGVLYRPSENKLKNAKAKDYMGKAKLVATSDENEAYTTFTGVTRLKQGITPSGAYVDDQSAPPGETTNLNRAATVSVTSRPSVPDPTRLQRAKTTINVPADARERIRAANNNSFGAPAAGVAAAAITSGAAAGVSRSTTSASGRSMPPANPVRGLSVRRPGQQVPPSIQDGGAPMRGGPPSGQRSGGPRSGGGGGGADDFIDDFIDGYDDYGYDDSVSPNGRTAAWAKNAGGHQRARSVAPSSYSGGAPMGRRPTTRSVHSRAQSMYDNSGSMIRVKIHYNDDVRGMTIDSSVPFDEFVERIAAKFERSFKDLGIKFEDDDGAKITLRDESDYELAIETACDPNSKSEGKLKIWCNDA